MRYYRWVCKFSEQLVQLFRCFAYVWLFQSESAKLCVFLLELLSLIIKFVLLCLQLPIASLVLVLHILNLLLVLEQLLLIISDPPLLDFILFVRSPQFQNYWVHPVHLLPLHFVLLNQIWLKTHQLRRRDCLAVGVVDVVQLVWIDLLLHIVVVLVFSIRIY